MSARARWILLCILLLGAVVLIVPGPIRTYFLESNLRTVVPGQVYRSAQPSQEELAEWIDTLGLATVVNLRGDGGGSEWLREEREVTEQRGVEHRTVRLGANRMPPAQKLRQVVAVLDEAPKPLLFHCRGGVERSGLVGALAVLLEGGDLAAAGRHFSLEKGYVPALSRSDLPRVLDDYESWLGREGIAHSPQALRRFVAEGYVPYYYAARIEALGGPFRFARGESPVLRFRVTNEAPRVIPLRSELRGVHLGAFLEAPSGARTELRGLFVDVALAPGESTEMELPLPTLASPGRYDLEVDLVDQRKWFADMGSQRLEVPISVR